EFLPLGRRSARQDLELEVVDAGARLPAWLHYSADLFDEGDAARMAGHLRTLLEAVAADPDQRLSRLPLLPEAERGRLLSEWSRTHADYSREVSVHALFEEQAARTPDKAASVGPGGPVTFRELNERADALAHLLTELRK
ncbi:MAG TPA: condensation domain-containing protein, partial [Pyrinomonadaceae bacterium]|nr:condensation domain-containing protein [Pyrinomonadaceae bacterium]